MEMEIDLYLQTTGIELRGQNREFTDPLVWLERMAERKHFPILSQMAKVFLAISSTLASSERMWSRSGKILSAKTARPKANVTLVTMFVAENAEVFRKHYEQIVETVSDPVTLYLPEGGK